MYKRLGTIGRPCTSLVRQLSSSINTLKNVKIEEVKIPTLNGAIAGKLWRSAAAEPSGAGESVHVICTHGFLDNAATFDTLIPLLIKPGMTFLSIDLPGHGFSSPWPGTYYDHHMAGLITLTKIQNYYKWPRFVVMGHSLGAQINYVYSSAFPEYVDRLISIDNFHPVPAALSLPTWFRSVSTKQLNWETKYVPDRAPPSYSYDEIVDKLYFGRGESITRESCEILLTRGAIKQADGKYSWSYDICATLTELPPRFTNEEAKRIGKGIKSPICLIKADPGADYQPREQFLKIVEYIKSVNRNVQFHMVPGTHSVHINEPHKIAPIISEFLETKFEVV